MALAAAAMFVALVGVPSASGHTTPEYSDVPEGHVAESAIRWAAQNGITVGVGNNRFGVGQTLTRYQMITFLCRAYDPGSCDSGTKGSDSFEDVPVDHWANYAVGWGFKLGYTSGISATEFGGDQTLTREQMITFLYRAEASPPAQWMGDEVFQDVPDYLSHWASVPIGWAYDQGVTGGIATGVFGFGTNVSREEMVLFLCRTVAPGTCQPSRQPLPSSVVPGSGTTVEEPPTTNPEEEPTNTPEVSVGDSVAVYLCGPPSIPAEWADRIDFDFQPYTEEGLRDLVDLLNDRVAPYYTWQSSGKFTLTYTEGGVISIPTEDFWPSYVSRSARREQTFDRCRMPAHPRHSAYVIPDVFNRNSHALVGYSASAGYSINFTTAHDFSATTDRVVERLLHTVSHETDHAVFGHRHLGDYFAARPWICYGACIGSAVRYFEEVLWREDFQAVAFNDLDNGIWSRYVDLLFSFYDPSQQERRHFQQGIHIEGDRSQLKEGERGLWACKRREELGWPVGAGAPPCIREAPDRPELKPFARTGAGDVVVDVIPPAHSDNTEVSGYILYLYEERELDLGNVDVGSVIEALDAFLPRTFTQYAVGDSFDVVESRPFWALDSLFGNSPLSRASYFGGSADYSYASADAYRSYAAVIEDIVGETVCARIACMDLPFLDYRIRTGPIENPGSTARDDYCSGETVLCYMVVTQHLLGVDDFPHTLTGLVPGNKYRVGISAWSPYGVSDHNGWSFQSGHGWQRFESRHFVR